MSLTLLGLSHLCQGHFPPVPFCEVPSQRRYNYKLPIGREKLMCRRLLKPCPPPSPPCRIKRTWHQLFSCRPEKIHHSIYLIYENLTSRSVYTNYSPGTTVLPCLRPNTLTCISESGNYDPIYLHGNASFWIMLTICTWHCFVALTYVKVPKTLTCVS